MRPGPSALLLAALLVAPAGLHADTGAPSAQPGIEVDGNEDAAAREEALDILFERLVAAESAGEARAFEEAIRAIWLDSGSPSIDLLMTRGFDALREDDFDRAYFYFDEVVTLAPGFAEGWDKRAAIHYIREDYAQALRDIEQVLRLEPRHYQAMAGFGIILEELGDKKGALEAFRRALALNPWLENIGERIAPLELEVEGRGI